MTPETNDTPKLSLLLQTLLRKTREGKLQWQQTVDEHTFLAGQPDDRVLEISAKFGGVREWEERLMRDVVVNFIVRDGDGNPIVEHSAVGDNTLEFDLYKSAERVARRVDQEVEKLIEWANSV